MSKRILGTVLIVGALFASSAECQSGGVTKALSFTGTSTLDRAVEGPGGAVEITAATDSSNATLKYSRSVSGPEGKYYMFTLTGSAPIDKSADRTDLVSLDGLRNAFTLGAKYTWFRLSGVRNPQATPENAERNDQICQELFAAAKARGIEEPECDTDNVKNLLPARFDEFKSLFFDPNGALLSAGLEPKIGHQKFSFLEAETLSKQSETKVPLSIEGFIGWVPNATKTLFTLGGNYQRGFKAADSGTLCPASSGSGTVACKTGAIGKPVSDDAELLYLEIRRRFGSVGASLKLTYDFKTDLSAVDLPITFIKDKDGNLTGGIRAGWTKTGHWQAGIFAGKAFSLF